MCDLDHKSQILNKNSWDPCGVYRTGYKKKRNKRREKPELPRTLVFLLIEICTHTHTHTHTHT
jgi:hypothetical protein